MRNIKHVPMRTCQACRQVKEKGVLTRLVRLSSGVVEVDISGKKTGRGAYLCRSQVCWETGLKGGRLEHSLKTTLTQENREQLSKFSQDLLQGETGGK